MSSRFLLSGILGLLTCTALGQEDFDVPEKLEVMQAPARKKHAITTECSIAFNSGTGKEINAAWQVFLETHYQFKVKGLGTHTHADALMHSSWGAHAFNLESEVELIEGKETLVVLLYPVKEDRKAENDNILNGELHYLSTVLHDFAKQFYSDKMNAAISHQQEIVDEDQDALEDLRRSKQRIEKTIRRSENRIARLERKQERLERRIARMNGEIETAGRNRAQTQQSIENDRQQLEATECDITDSEDVLRRSVTQMGELQEKLRKIESL